MSHIPTKDWQWAAPVKVPRAPTVLVSVRRDETVQVSNDKETWMDVEVGADVSGFRWLRTKPREPA